MKQRLINFKTWYRRTFLVISEQEAIERDLKFIRNVHDFNYLDIPSYSIWEDSKGRTWRVRDVIDRFIRERLNKNGYETTRSYK